MMLVSNKDLKQTVKEGNAIDITTISEEELRNLMETEKDFKHLARSKNTYGTSGVLVQGMMSKDLYAIVAPNSNLFILL